MKCIVLLVALSVVCAVSAVPMPQHGMFFYQQAGYPSSYYRQPVHRMYMQYQPYRAAALRRSAFAPSSGISAYVSDTDQQAAEPETLADDIPVGVENDDGAVSIAEAYPPPAADEEADEPQNDEPEFLAPVAPQGNKNKVTVQLDPAAVADEEEVAVQEDEQIYRRRPANNNGGTRPSTAGAAAAHAPAPSNPINTYFPINFGNTNGGAIAVANSYSTGQKGGARSHAIAYGSPATAAKKRKAISAAVAQ